MMCRAALLVLAVAALTSACASHAIRPWEYQPKAMADTLAIWEPEEREASLVYDALHHAIFRPLAQGVDLNRQFAGPPPALNADVWDGVVNSTWFTNRNGVEALAPDAVYRGSHTGDGPDQSGPVEVKDLKAEGVNPGFFIKDAAGDRYLIKFDPPDLPEMATGADVLATNLVWAAGYHTPENYVFALDPEKLVLDLDEGTEIFVMVDDEVVNYEVGAEDEGEELTIDVFRKHFLDIYPRQADGTIRALASKFLKGTPKGPFSYQKTRPDDPNDVIDHEHRRELRGYYVIASWINQVDTKQGNTLDMFVLDPKSPEDPEEGRRFGYLRHYMLDNGAALSSGGVHAHVPRHGTENDFDLNMIGKRFVSLGFYQAPWQTLADSSHPASIGYYSDAIFEPGNWRPNMPNPAFDNRDARDGYWGAKIVMSFTDAQLTRAVDATEWSDASARAYILKGLKARRDAIGRYWFGEVSPLERPRIEGGALVFEDLWLQYFGGAQQYRYNFSWEAPDPDVNAEGTVNAPRIPLPFPASIGSADPEHAHTRLEVWRRAPDGDWAPRPATFWLAWDAAARTYQVVGARY
ncbi:MAG: hypothetical protein ABR559_04670 [Gemmatimonadota bacterium]